jgi:hypothetical protein
MCLFLVQTLEGDGLHQKKGVEQPQFLEGVEQREETKVQANVSANVH